MNNQNNPLVSVIVPVYNVEQYIDECLISICKQTYEKIEIIIVEDCSTDNSLDVLSKYFDDKRVKLIRHEKNSGLSAARNTGIDTAIGDYLIFVDSDDLIHESLIELCVKYAIEKEAELITYDFKVFYDQFKINDDKELLNIDNSEIKESKNNYFREPHFAWLKFIKTNLIKNEKLYFPVGLYYEDWPFHWNLGLISKCKYHLPIELVFYRQRVSSITGTLDNRTLDIFKIQLMVLDLIEKHQAFEVKGIIAEKIKLNNMFIISHINRNLLLEGLSQSKKMYNHLKLKNYKEKMNFQTMVLNIIMEMPVYIGLIIIYILRYALNIKRLVF